MSITIQDIANAALDELFLRSYALKDPHHSRVERDHGAKIAPSTPGDIAYVCTQHVPLGMAVTLNQIASSSFHTSANYWGSTIENFTHYYLTIAMNEVAAQLDEARSKVSDLDRERVPIGVRGNPIVFASAPLTYPAELAEHHVGVAYREGVSLRASRAYDIAKLSELVEIDVLFGLKFIDIR